MEGEEGTRHLAKGSRAIWVGKWVERGSRILGKLGAARTVHLWSSALHRATAGAQELSEGTNKWLEMVCKLKSLPQGQPKCSYQVPGSLTGRLWVQGPWKPNPRALSRDS